MVASMKNSLPLEEVPMAETVSVLRTGNRNHGSENDRNAVTPTVESEGKCDLIPHPEKTLWSMKIKTRPNKFRMGNNR